MSQEEVETFAITWRIKNFSMCPVKFGRYIESPVIRIRKFANSEWILQLYPKGKNKEGFVGCALKCNSLGHYNKQIHTVFHLSVYPEEEERTRLVGDFSCNKSGGRFDWIPLERILQEREKFLPNDTFTMKCSLKCVRVPREIQEELVQSLAWQWGKDPLKLNKCCIETTIDVHKNSVLWAIPRFQWLAEKQNQVLPVFSSVKNVPSIFVTLSKRTPCPYDIDVKMSKENDEIPPEKVFTRCRISVLHTSRDIICFDGECPFESSLHVLLDYSGAGDLGKYFLSPDSTLYLRFDFTISLEGEMRHSELHDWAPLPITCTKPNRSAFVPPTDEDEQQFLKLRVGKEGKDAFSAHKIVLNSESEAFRTMFEQDMQEKKTGEVAIEDVDPWTLGRMVHFLYKGNGSDDELDLEDAMKLYAVGHKYLIKSLVDYCSSILMSSLAESNVCHILVHADFYGNDHLWKCAEDFVLTLNDPERFLMSEVWKNFMEEKLALASKVMYKMLMK